MNLCSFVSCAYSVMVVPCRYVCVPVLGIIISCGCLTLFIVSCSISRVVSGMGIMHPVNIIINSIIFVVIIFFIILFSSW